jgi:hypothetical protein
MRRLVAERAQEEAAVVAAAAAAEVTEEAEPAEGEVVGQQA